MLFRSLRVKLSLSCSVWIHDIRFRLQEGLDGSGIHPLRVESSLRRPVQIQDFRFRLQEGVDDRGIRTLRV